MITIEATGHNNQKNRGPEEHVMSSGILSKLYLQSLFPSIKKAHSLLTEQRVLNHFHVQEIISFRAFVVCDALRNHFLYLSFKISAKLIDVPLVSIDGWINTLKHSRKYTKNFDQSRRRRLSEKPIITRSKYVKSAFRAGKRLRINHN